MKLTITVDTDRYPDLPWPNGMPLPAAGDEVVVNHAGETISFVVDRCSFDLTREEQDSARIHIHGHHAPSGSV
jgi:hypothetical protein